MGGNTGLTLLGSSQQEDDEKETEESKSKPPPPLSERPLNLFDGKALAYYMVSQKQFIDPFTRRDLTREELVNLDSYNQKNKDGKSNNEGNNMLRVVDAYDAKGISLST